MEPVLTPAPVLPERTPRRKRSKLRMTIGAIVVLWAFGAAVLWWLLYWPNGRHDTPVFEGKPIFYNGRQLSLPAQGTKESVKLPFSVYKDIIDPTILYENESKSVIITTQDKVVRLRTSQLTATMNEKPFTLRFAIEQVGETLYLPVEPLRAFYNLDVRESDDTGAVLLFKGGDALQWAKVPEQSNHPERTVPMRIGASVKSPIAADLKQGQRLLIWSDEGNWYRVQLENGFLGYVKKSAVQLDSIEKVPVQEKKPGFVPWKPIGGKINLTWQQLGEKPIDTGKIKDMPGLNVISPQWFHLLDGAGNVQSKSDTAFIKWAHDRGYQVWGLFNNGFDPKRTTEALATYDKRLLMIKQVLAYAEMYDIQGVNVDFENVNLKDKANMVQFVREMTPFMHEQGLVVSIDVTVKDGSETYSLFMDRRAVGEVVDYMMIMTYDEHWSTSPVAGSVASLPWVEKGIVKIMKEDAVPASKLLLGIPYYTRIWTEQTKDGKLQVSSQTGSMEAVQKIIKDKGLAPVKDEASGQNYVQYAEGGKTMKIWIEDAESIRSRVELAKKLDLAGIASWSRGFETQSIWDLIRTTLEKRP